MTSHISQSYEQAIYSALEGDDGNRAEERVKDVVIDELRALDRTAQVTSTRYFNHTFAPDLILSWPHESTSDRYVYLRLTDSLPFLREGLALLDKPDSIVFNLYRPQGDQLDDYPLLADTARETPTLVTDAAAIETFIDRQVDNQFLGLVSNALAHGGRGLIDIRAAQETSRLFEEGFDGAQALDVEETQRASAAVVDVFNDQQAAKINGLLQAVWIGNGGQLAEFPGTAEASTDPGESALQFLLNFDEIDDKEFWSRIGRGSNIDQIARLRLRAPSRNLQHFMRANLSHLWARALVVVPDEQNDQPQRTDSTSVHLDDRTEPLDWTVNDGLVGLRGPNFSAYVGQRAADVRAAPNRGRFTAEGISIATLRQRARGVAISSLVLNNGRDRGDISSVLSDEDILQGDRLEELAAGFGLSAQVEKAQVALPNGQHVSIDFLRQTATAVTRTKIGLADLIGFTTPVLWYLDADTEVALTATLNDEIGPADFDEAVDQEIDDATRARFQSLPPEVRRRMLEDAGEPKALPPGVGDDG